MHVLPPVFVRPTITMKLLVLFACLLVLGSARRPGGWKGGRGLRGLICSDGCKPTCSDGEMPVCEDGSEPVGRRCEDTSKPSCSDGERPDTCSDGSEPAKRPKPCEEGRPSCEDDSRPSCEDGSRPRKGKCGDGSQPLCEDEEEPVCPDGSPIVKPPTCPN